MRAYLLTDALGQLYVLPFRLYQAASLTLVREDQELLPPGLTRQTNNANDNNRGSKAVVYYRIREAEGIRSVATHEAPRQQYMHNNQAAVVIPPVDSLFTSSADALYLAHWMRAHS